VLIGSVLFCAAVIAIGIAFIWDIGGLASKMRVRAEESPVSGGLYRRMPSWAFRAFGVWWIICGIGWLIYAYGLTHGEWH
jgi:hypothetical protein